MSAPRLDAPFPYFGGKSRVSAEVWSRFGRVDSYVEPFFGSGAVLLGRPSPSGVETVNDLDGLLSNFWRAVRHSPDAVAEFADWPVSEVDLHARHMVLVEERAGLTERLLVDPDYYDARLAGWWAWGASCWIGHGWCSGEGPWVREGGRMVKRDAGRGVSRQLPHLGNAGQGVNRQLPHLSRPQGVNRQLPHLGDAGRLNDWMRALSARLRQVRIACGSWERILGPSTTWRHGLTAVFLDPPYAAGNMDYSAGGMGLGVADDVRAWCIEQGSRRDMRIGLCGHGSEHSALEAEGWSRYEWQTVGGYGTTEEARGRGASETIWFSPACVTSQLRLL
jgi:site-specific DNA-adenine methylase